MSPHDKTLAERRKDRFIEVAYLKIDGKLSWEECWTISRNDLLDYADAVTERAERIRLASQ